MSASSAGQVRVLPKNIFDPIEQAFVFGIADRCRLEVFLGQRLGELLEQLLLIFRQLFRRRHLHGDQQITASSSRYVGHALAANAERPSGLRAGWNRERRFAVERRDLDLAAEGERGEAHRDFAVEIVAVTLEERVLLHMNDDVEIT